MGDRRQDLLDKAAAVAPFPPQAQDQLLRSVGDEPVRAFVVHDTYHTDLERGVSVQVRVAALTPSRLLHFSWFEAPADEDAVDTKGEPGPLVVFARTVTLRSLSAVHTTVEYQGEQVSNASVLIFSEALNSLVTEPTECGNPECEADHGTHTTVFQDALRFDADTQARSAQDVTDLLDFAAALDVALAAA